MIKIFPEKKKQRFAPPATRIYAIGDIHGSLGPLKKVHKLILSEELKRGRLERSIIIYLGDYVDRGEYSKEVLDYLINTKLKGFTAIYIRGNHEYAMLEFLENPQEISVWLNWGGDATLRSYGLDVHKEMDSGLSIEEISRRFSKLIPQSHIDFCKNMKPYHVEGDYIFVHAGLKPGIKLQNQDEMTMMMIRQEFYDSDYDFGKNVVFGHTIFEKPFVKNGRIGIDTGAFYSGKLTCAVMEKDKLDFLYSS